MPREGIFAKVLKGGAVRPQDPILVLDTAAASIPQKDRSKTKLKHKR
jgi:MOSC domain-containing protein YiiM